MGNNAYWCKINETAYILHRLNNNESYVIIHWLVHKTYLFGDTQYNYTVYFGILTMKSYYKIPIQ